MSGEAVADAKLQRHAVLGRDLLRVASHYVLGRGDSQGTWAPERRFHENADHSGTKSLSVLQCHGQGLPGVRCVIQAYQYLVAHRNTSTILASQRQPAGRRLPWGEPETA